MTNRYLNNANRPLMAAFLVSAALVLSACGGGGGGEGSRLDSAVPFSERESNSDSTGSGSTNDSGSEDLVEVEDSSTGDGAPSTGGSTGDNTQGAGSDGSTAEQTPPSEPVTSDVSAKGVVLRWSVPTRRHNGQPLDRDELDGYEIRYREVSESGFRTIPIENGVENEFVFEEELNGSYEFQIAAYDVNGLYSEFVNLTPYE